MPPGVLLGSGKIACAFADLPCGSKPGNKERILAACQRRGGCLYAKKEQEAHSKKDRPPFT
jgi:hypothetical protein